MDDVLDLTQIHFFNRGIILEELYELRRYRHFFSHNNGPLLLFGVFQFYCFWERFDGKGRGQLGIFQLLFLLLCQFSGILCLYGDLILL